MKLKAAPVEIPPDEPFRHDLLERKVCAEQLTELLKSSDDSLVLCISAEWGNGKTTFLKMWRQHLINEEFKTLYFNAWENDYSEDALVSLIGELSAGIGELRLSPEKTKRIKGYLDKAKKLGAVLIKKGVPLAVRMGTGGIINAAEFNLDEDAITKLSELGEEVAKKQIEKYEESKKTINGFREELKSFADEITSPEEGTDRFPLVIFVDELDRCRPPYAVQVLEKVKHLFNVPNIVFVIAVDKDQLGHSIKSMYGQGMDVGGYLRRFIDLDFSLPIPDTGAFCDAQFAKFGLVEIFKKRTGDLVRNDVANLKAAFTAFLKA